MQRRMVTAAYRVLANEMVEQALQGEIRKSRAETSIREYNIKGTAFTPPSMEDLDEVVLTTDVRIK